MNTETVNITEALRITDAPDLDPITVIFQDTAPEQGRTIAPITGHPLNTPDPGTAGATIPWKPSPTEIISSSTTSHPSARRCSER